MAPFGLLLNSMFNNFYFSAHFSIKFSSHKHIFQHNFKNFQNQTKWSHSICLYIHLMIPFISNMLTFEDIYSLSLLFFLFLLVVFWFTVVVYIVDIILLLSGQPYLISGMHLVSIFQRACACTCHMLACYAVPAAFGFMKLLFFLQCSF